MASIKKKKITKNKGQVWKLEKLLLDWIIAQRKLKDRY